MSICTPYRTDTQSMHAVPCSDSKFMCSSTIKRHWLLNEQLFDNIAIDTSVKQQAPRIPQWQTMRCVSARPRAVKTEFYALPSFEFEAVLWHNDAINFMVFIYKMRRWCQNVDTWLLFKYFNFFFFFFFLSSEFVNYSGNIFKVWT